MAVRKMYFRFGAGEAHCGNCLGYRFGCSCDQLDDHQVAAWHQKHRPAPVVDQWAGERKRVGRKAG